MQRGTRWLNYVKPNESEASRFQKVDHLTWNDPYSKLNHLSFKTYKMTPISLKSVNFAKADTHFFFAICILQTLETQFEREPFLCE